MFFPESSWLPETWFPKPSHVFCIPNPIVPGSASRHRRKMNAFGILKHEFYVHVWLSIRLLFCELARSFARLPIFLPTLHTYLPIHLLTYLPTYGISQQWTTRFARTHSITLYHIPIWMAFVVTFLYRFMLHSHFYVSLFPCKEIYSTTTTIEGNSGYKWRNWDLTCTHQRLG